MMRLIYHPESDCLFLDLDGTFKFDGADGALCNDVTRQEWALKRAAAEGLIEDWGDGIYAHERKHMSNPATVFRTGLRIELKLITPPGPNDTTVQISEAALNSVGSLSAVWPNGITRTCISCDHFTEKETCRKAHDQRPPARVIAFGCEKYEDDLDVPF